MSWFKREDHEIVNDAQTTVRTRGCGRQCGSCRLAIFTAGHGGEPECVPEVRVPLPHRARRRIELLLEPGYELVDLELRSTDPLDFTDLKRYRHRLAEARKKTGLERRDCECGGNDGAARGDDERDGVWVHWRNAWARWWARRLRGRWTDRWRRRGRPG